MAIRYVVAIRMPGAFRPLSQTFSRRADAEAALAAIPSWSQRRNDLKNKIRQSWYRTGMEAVLKVNENGNALEVV